MTVTIFCPSCKSTAEVTYIYSVEQHTDGSVGLVDKEDPYRQGLFCNRCQVYYTQPESNQWVDDEIQANIKQTFPFSEVK